MIELIRMLETNRDPFLLPGKGRGHDILVKSADIRLAFYLAQGAYRLYTALRRDPFSPLIFHQISTLLLVMRQSRFFYLKIAS
jgi:hypothetical protein